MNNNQVDPMDSNDVARVDSGQSIECDGDGATLIALASRRARIEQKLEVLISSKNQVTQDFYSTADVARILGKAEWTVREWWSPSFGLLVQVEPDCS